jgi:hypothetical protein
MAHRPPQRGKRAIQSSSERRKQKKNQEELGGDP